MRRVAKGVGQGAWLAGRSPGSLFASRSVERFMDGSLLELPVGCYLERGDGALLLKNPDGSILGRLNANGSENGRDGAMPLQARFLGNFELLRDEEAVFLGHNGRALSILKYLLANRPRPVSQDCLMCWLWPESNLKHARWSLNSAIYALRRILGGCLASVAPPDTVLFEKGAYRLSQYVRVSTDIGEFDTRCEKGFRLEGDGRVSEADAEYERAVGLYRGDYLAEDLYEDWTQIERERLMDSYTEMLGRLAVHHMEKGEYREGIGCCYRVLEKDRCNEEAHRLLMECFSRLGRRARAIRQYRLCERSLGSEWDMAPSPETRALHAVIAGNADLRRRA